MRLPWPKNFPPLFSHITWKELDGHAHFKAAKTKADVGAALDLIDSVANTNILDDIVDQLRNEKTLVLAPALTPETNKNALALGYAAWLARELDLEACKTIFQIYRPKKDRLGFWQRMAYPSAFEGQIPANCDFILVDDVCTFGGTLADLRSFIESKESRVILASTIASQSGGRPALALRGPTLDGLNRAYGSSLDGLLAEEFGYETRCLCEREGRTILDAGLGIDGVRERVLKARNA